VVGEGGVQEEDEKEEGRVVMKCCSCFLCLVSQNIERVFEPQNSQIGVTALYFVRAVL
jgi:hypothetical protein